ncbi:MAG: hypothetical protein DLM67_23545 [Candidatus Nephthysia bennettiae]|uniref:Uncharacterized protein n=1 Tax=Candidatus Nephthysia bennettiae TaxID=3127016 RepID=A0A934K5F3_9BACT|nr:hypothetical protein [Candidatus Dormibacteraeota bacterium]MBJ7612094.1 hypothetical protein [Candidatus Dormibacteraeota bacterium]PZR86716.1 MAG: hypothetical protein DLM67_23545 [Candidatus Dormibacteraeota bacterium]
MIRLTIDMPRWVWWLALRFRLGIALELEGELLAPLDLVQHGRPLTLIYRGSMVGGNPASRAAVGSLPGSR